MIIILFMQQSLGLKVSFYPRVYNVDPQVKSRTAGMSVGLERHKS